MELTGVEPVSKNSPTFRRLQFISLLDKTVTMTMSEPVTESACELSGSSYMLRVHLICLNTQSLSTESTEIGSPQRVKRYSKQRGVLLGERVASIVVCV